MQDEHIGKHCEQCNRKDYIPYTCRKCSRTLCDEHYWQHPCVTDQYKPKTHTDQSQPKPEHRCTVPSCNKKLFTVNHYYCTVCDKLFCLAHRLPEDHHCKTSKQDNCIII